MPPALPPWPAPDAPAAAPAPTTRAPAAPPSRAGPPPRRAPAPPPSTPRPCDWSTARRPPAAPPAGAAACRAAPASGSSLSSRCAVAGRRARPDRRRCTAPAASRPTAPRTRSSRPPRPPRDPSPAARSPRMCRAERASAAARNRSPSSATLKCPATSATHPPPASQGSRLPAASPRRIHHRTHQPETVLQGLALIETGASGPFVHRLLQEAVRKRLRPDQTAKWSEAAVCLMKAAFPFVEDDPATWASSGELLGHASAAAEYADQQASAETAAALHDRLG